MKKAERRELLSAVLTHLEAAAKFKIKLWAHSASVHPTRFILLLGYY
jgi:hypothetical protein